MLYDRPYMRNVHRRREIPYLYWILGTIVAGFLVQNVAAVWMGQGRFIANWFALGIDQVMAGRVWTLLTYSLLHGGIFHILFNCLIIYFAGRSLEPIIGQKRVLQVYLAAVLIGGLVYIGVHYQGGIVEGASAGAVGLLILYCLVQPDRPITLLLFFVIPVTLKPRWVIWILLGFDGLGFLFTELPQILGTSSLIASPVAYSAHLGGMLAGWLYYRFILSPSYGPAGSRKKLNIEPPEWLKRKPRAAKASRGFKLNMTTRSDLKKEVDRILDKINSKGFGALSDEEKETLDRARDILKN